MPVSCQCRATLPEGVDTASTRVVWDEMELDADRVSDRIEQGAHLHCSCNPDVAQRVADLLGAEAALRGEDPSEKLAEWHRAGRWHTSCMCGSSEPQIGEERP